MMNFCIRLNSNSILFCSTILMLWILSMVVQNVHAHMGMTVPRPRDRDDTTFDHPYQNYIETFKPCGKIPGIPKNQNVIKVTAGQQLPTVLYGFIPHGGGHCEYSLSYDEETFVSIHTIFRTCFPPNETILKDFQEFPYTITIPKEAPRGPAVFAWSWIPGLDVHEFYMNCVDVFIENDHTDPMCGPEMMVGNLKGHFHDPKKTPYQEFPHMFNLSLEHREWYSQRPVLKIAPNLPSKEPRFLGYQHDPSLKGKTDFKCPPPHGSKSYLNEATTNNNGNESTSQYTLSAPPPSNSQPSVSSTLSPTTFSKVANQKMIPPTNSYNTPQQKNKKKKCARRRK